jgi:predicted dehydrogenase
MINSSRSGKFRFALVGAGMIGTHHAKVISELADQIELVAVVNRTLEKAEKITAQRGGTAFASLTDAMAATDIDVVVICTPPGGRAEVAIEALEAGKHVIIEKPAEVSLTKIDDIIAAQQKAGTLVTVISQHRFDPSTEVALAAIHNGVHGDKGSIVIDNDELSFIPVSPIHAAREEKVFGSKDDAINQVAEYALPGTTLAAGRAPGQLSDAHRHQYENFLTALRGEHKIRVGLAENRQSVSVVLAAYESARTGHPVRLA